MLPIVPIFDELEKQPGAKRKKDCQVVIRCPICDENGKAHDHGHCYVGLIRDQDTSPIVYNCFINHCSGIVTPDFLKAVNIYDQELNNILTIWNNERLRNSKVTNRIDYVKRSIAHIEQPEYSENKRVKDKLTYLQGRMQINFNLENVKPLNVVWTLTEFLKHNKIDPNPNFKKLIKVLDSDYLGFLSQSKEYIIFRNLVKNNNLRYFKYPIFQESHGIMNYVIRGTKADLLAEDVDLVLAEGPFDIIGIYANVYHCRKDQIIYSAVCGSSYQTTIRKFIKMGFVKNLNIHIYSDSDKQPFYYKTLIKNLGIWCKSINLYYNELSKDCGVPGDQIKIVKISNKIFSR